MRLWGNFFKGADSVLGESLFAFLPFAFLDCIHNGWSVGSYLATEKQKPHGENG